MAYNYVVDVELETWPLMSQILLTPGVPKTSYRSDGTLEAFETWSDTQYLFRRLTRIRHAAVKKLCNHQLSLARNK